MVIRLCRYKKENKELVTYLVYEAHNEPGYIAQVKEFVTELFADLPKGNVYYIKKSLRKILRILNKQVKYSGQPRTELELRIFFCVQVREAKVPVKSNTVLSNMYAQQLKKINAILDKLPEDLQADYETELTRIKL